MYFMQKLCSIFAVCAGLFFSTDVGAQNDVAQSLSLENEKHHLQLKVALEKLAPSHKYIAFADPDHSAPSLKKFKANTHVLKALSNAGCGLYVNENRVENNDVTPDINLDSIEVANTYADVQNILCHNFEASDDFFSDTLYYGRYIHQYIDDQSQHSLACEAKFLINTRRLGIEVFYPDTRYAYLDENEDIKSYIADIQSFWRDGNASYTLIASDAYNNKFEGTAIQTKVMDEFFGKMTQHFDELITFNIKLKEDTPSIENSKTALFYGLSHFQGRHDLNEMLGKDETLVIALLPKKDYIPEVYESFVWDEPDLYYVVEDEELFYDYEMEAVYEQYLKDNPQSVDRNMTQEDYNTAVQMLPDTLKSYAVPYEYYKN